MDKFKSELTLKGDTLSIKLSGHINEDTLFPVPSIKQGNLVFNFSEVTYINSLGIRSWVNYLKNLGNFAVALEECPPQIVRQMIMTPSFAQNAKVLSIYVPYSCDDCNSKKTVLVERAEWEKTGKQISEKLHCDKCNENSLEMDGDSEQYVAFWDT